MSGYGMRAANMWDALHRLAAEGQRPDPSSSRGIVTKEDACRALLQASLAIDRAVRENDGQLPDGYAGHIMAMLMVARDYVEPLPRAGDPDQVSADLQYLVDVLRVTEIDRLEFGE